MSSKSMSRMIFAIAAAALIFILAAGGLAQDRQGAENAKEAAARQRVPVVITSADRTVPEESLPPETRVQVERVRKAAENLVGQSGTSERLRVKVMCTFPPLECTITIHF